MKTRKSNSRSSVAEVKRDVGSAGVVEPAVFEVIETPLMNLTKTTFVVVVAVAVDVAVAVVVAVGVSGEVAFAAAVQKDFVVMSAAAR